MGKILAPRLQEIILSSSDKAESAKISKWEKQQLIRKIAPRIYTSNLGEDPASIIGRNWFQILARQCPTRCSAIVLRLNFGRRQEDMFI